jgi:hypothetical protein
VGDLIARSADPDESAQEIADHLQAALDRLASIAAGLKERPS